MKKQSLQVKEPSLPSTPFSHLLSSFFIVHSTLEQREANSIYYLLFKHKSRGYSGNNIKYLNDLRSAKKWKRLANFILHCFRRKRTID